MSANKFKTMRHIETVRNYMNTVVGCILTRGQNHDQSKLQPPELEIFEGCKNDLRTCTYGSSDWEQNYRAISSAIDHHHANNRHHPEFFLTKLEVTEWVGGALLKSFNLLGRMNMIDLVEMVVDWKASTLRHNDGDIYKSIEKLQEKYGYTDELKCILINTAKMLDESKTKHYAEES